MTEKVKQHAAPVTGSDEIDIGRLVGTVIEARWWVIGITTVFALCAVVYTFFVTPIYSADALVQIEQNSGNSLVQDIGSALANKLPASDAEIQLIRSRLVLGKTVDDLDLDIAVSKNTFPIFGAGWERLTGRQNETVKVTTTPVFSHIPRLQASKDFQVLVRVEAPPALQQHRRVPVDLAVVLDVGASTGAGTARLDAVKKAVKFIIRQIHDDDRLAVVGPSNYRLVTGFLNTRDARRNAEKSVDQLEPRGEFTSGSGTGLEEAIKVGAVRATFRSSSIHNCCLNNWNFRSWRSYRRRRAGAAARASSSW